MIFKLNSGKIWINAELNIREFNLLKDMLGHMNYDEEESKTYSELYRKIATDKLLIKGN